MSLGFRSVIPGLKRIKDFYQLVNSVLQLKLELSEIENSEMLDIDKRVKKLHILGKTTWHSGGAANGNLVNLCTDKSGSRLKAAIFGARVFKVCKA